MDDQVAERLRAGYAGVKAPAKDELLGGARLRRGRLRSLRTAVAAALLIPAALIAWLLGGAAGPAQTWAAVPRPADPALASEAVTACSASGMDLQVLDARGNGVVAFFANSGNAELCHMTLKADGSPGAIDTSQTHLAGGSAAGLAVVTEVDDPNNGLPTLVVGRVSAVGTTVHVLIGPGVDVTASVNQGYFLAWWPNGQAITRIESRDSEGAMTDSISGAAIP
jgi:hypothetical protein